MRNYWENGRRKAKEIGDGAKMPSLGVGVGREKMGEQSRSDFLKLAN